MPSPPPALCFRSHCMDLTSERSNVTSSKNLGQTLKSRGPPHPPALHKSLLHFLQSPARQESSEDVATCVPPLAIGCSTAELWAGVPWFYPLGVRPRAWHTGGLGPCLLMERRDEGAIWNVPALGVPQFLSCSTRSTGTVEVGVGLLPLACCSFPLLFVFLF